MPTRKLCAGLSALFAALAATVPAHAQSQRSALSVSAVVAPACSVRTPRAAGTADEPLPPRRLAELDCSAGANPRISVARVPSRHPQRPAALVVTLTY